MNRVLPRMLVLASCLGLAGCTAPSPEARQVSPADLVGGYVITGSSVPRVVQAFNDGRATYIQFASTPPAALTVQVGQLGTLAYRVRGDCIVVPGALTDLRLVSAQGVVRVQRAPASPVDTLARPTGPTGESAWQPDSNVDWSREDAAPGGAMPAPPGAPGAAPRAQPPPR